MLISRKPERATYAKVKEMTSNCIRSGITYLEALHLARIFSTGSVLDSGIESC
jgi:hypothetical protein